MTEYILIYLAGCLAVYLLMCKLECRTESWPDVFVAISFICMSWILFFVIFINEYRRLFPNMSIKPPKPPKLFFRFKNNKQK